MGKGGTRTITVAGIALLLLALTASGGAMSAPSFLNGIDWSWWDNHRVKDFDRLQSQERRFADFSMGSFGVNASSFFGHKIADDLFLGVYLNSLSTPVRRYFLEPYPGYENQRIGWTSLSPSIKFYLPLAYARPPIVFRPYGTAGLTASLGYRLPSFFGGSTVRLSPTNPAFDQYQSYRSLTSPGLGWFAGSGMDVHLTRTVRLNLDYKYSNLKFAKQLGNKINWSHHRWAVGLSFSFLRRSAPQAQPVMINRKAPVLTPDGPPRQN